VKWLWDDEWPEDIVYTHHGVWRNAQGYWFNDESQAGLCGPFITWRSAHQAMRAYAESL
jgi:hypothetical protein